MIKRSRRNFLRLATLTTTAGLAVACDLDGGAGGEAAGRMVAEATKETDATALSAPLPLDTPAPTQPAVRLELTGGSRAVWGWKQAVSGTLPADCAEAYITVGERKIGLKRDGERWSAEVPLDQGANEIAVTCRHQDNKEERSDVSTFTVELKRRPRAIIQIMIENGAIVLDGSASQPDEVGSAAIATYLWEPRDSNPAPLSMLADQQEAGAFAGERVIVTAPTTDGEYYVTLRVVDAEGREDIGASYFVIADGEPRVPNYDKEVPAWVDAAIVYGVIPRKFGDPAFAGIVEKLPYLQELGINTLWLSPINRSPGGDFGYAVVDYFDVNPDFGSRDDFRGMVTAAHAHGVRVLIDFVPNHSSAEHPYFQDAQARGKESPYYSFYDRDQSGTVTHYFDWEHLPNLNFDNPEVERFMIEAFSYWVREHAAWRDLLADETVTLRQSPPLLGIPMPAWGVRVLVPRPA